MKIQRKIKNMLKGKKIGLWGKEYFLNPRDAKLTWEEKKALLHLFEYMVEKAIPETNISSGIQFDEDTPGDVEYFCLGYRIGEEIDDWKNIYIFNYYSGSSDKLYVEDLVKKHGSHWGAFKAGLRGWYDYMLLTGLTDRVPTNYKSVAV